jgi:ribosomal RNA-processing protein 12
MFDLQQKAEKENRPSEAKVWSVLVAQVWTGLAGYCWAPVDLREVSQNPGPCIYIVH